MRGIRAVPVLALGLLSGCVTQGAGTQEVGAPSAHARAPSEISRDLPESIQRDVRIRSGDVYLAGVVTLPEPRGLAPAVVLVSGSGPQDRDGATADFLPGYRPSKNLADRLALDGIASLRYDERGVGESTGVHSSASIEDLADDAAVAFEYLQTVDGVDPERVGLLGHSEGSNIVAMIAARNPDVAFVVSLAGPGVTGSALGIAQGEHALRMAGLEGAEFEAGMADVRRQYELVVNGEWDELESMMREALPAQLDAMSAEERARLGSVDTIVADELTHMQNRARFFLTHDPAEDWARVRSPILALLGELDVQVTVDQNQAPLEHAFRRSPSDDWTIHVVPQANHLFQMAKTGRIDEYFTLPPSIDPDVLGAISRWIRDHTRR